MGKEIVDELDKNHIQHLIEKVPYLTGTVQVELREGIPTYTIHERVAWDHISPTSDAIDLAENIEKYDLRIFALTAGSSHSTIYTREETSTLPTPEVTVADTVGAGMLFRGSNHFALKGKSLSEAHHFAVKTAAFVCTKEGAWPVYEE